MTATRWIELTARDLRSRPEPIVDFYDQVTDACGRISSVLKVRRPVDLVKKGYVRLFQSLGDDVKYRAELSEPLVELLLDKGCEPKFVKGGDAVGKVIGSKAVWVGRDPQGRYPSCKCWYGRRIGNKLRARVLAELPLVTNDARAQKDETDRMAKLRRRAFRF